LFGKAAILMRLNSDTALVLQRVAFAKILKIASSQVEFLGKYSFKQFLFFLFVSVQFSPEVGRKKAIRKSINKINNKVAFVLFRKQFHLLRIRTFLIIHVSCARRLISGMRDTTTIRFCTIFIA